MKWKDLPELQCNFQIFPLRIRCSFLGRVMIGLESLEKPETKLKGKQGAEKKGPADQGYYPNGPDYRE